MDTPSKVRRGVTGYDWRALIQLPVLAGAEDPMMAGVAALSNEMVMSTKLYEYGFLGRETKMSIDSPNTLGECSL